MIIQNITVDECTPQTIVIGRRGTYDTMQIAFDLSFLIENYGSGTAVLAVKRSQDTSAYPAVVTQEDNTLTWTVSETDTYYVGSGECQLMWYVDGGLAKTIIYPMVVMRDILQTAEEPPDGYENWIERLTDLGAETQQNAQNAAQSASDASTAKDDAVTAKEAAVAAQQAAETAVTHYPVIINGYWNVWSVEAQSYVSTGIQAEGEDGYSPEVTITSIEGGHRVTITDKDHPQGQSFDVMDGQGGGGGNVNDVRVNNTSVLVDGIANVPVASANTYGVVKTGEFYGTKIVSGKLTINTASPGDIKEGETNYRPIAPLFADYAAFYGLARAAGDTSQALSPNTVGNYTDNAKTAIKNMLGVDAGGIAYDSTETYQAGTVGAELSNQSRQLSDLEDSISDAYDATASYAVGDFCINENTLYRCNTAIPTGGEAWTPAHWDAVQIVDLLGTGAGTVTDVQINGTSILEDGVANVPIGKGVLGVVSVGNYASSGIDINNNGVLQLPVVDNSYSKNGNYARVAVTIQRQHAAAFYGLAKAAGHDEKNSALAVGQYTEDAKSAIHEMLNGSVAVSGTTPTIVAKSGITYVCGEVATLDITIPASGIFEVQFVSGSTPTVLTATGVSWAGGFDPTALEANKTYDISISNGIGVAVWI